MSSPAVLSDSLISSLATLLLQQFITWPLLAINSVAVLLIEVLGCNFANVAVLAVLLFGVYFAVAEHVLGGVLILGNGTATLYQIASIHPRVYISLRPQSCCGISSFIL